MDKTEDEKIMSKCSSYHEILKVCKRGLFGPDLKLSDCLSCKFYDGPPRGLGDKVTRVISKSGIEGVMKSFMPKDKDCGCGKRRKFLNDKFPSEQKDD